MAEREDAYARMWLAESVVTLLARLDLDRLPSEAGRAVADCQATAVEEWLAAYAALRDIGAVPPHGALGAT